MRGRSGEKITRENDMLFPVKPPWLSQEELNVKVYGPPPDMRIYPFFKTYQLAVENLKAYPGTQLRVPLDWFLFQTDHPLRVKCISYLYPQTGISDIPYVAKSFVGKGAVLRNNQFVRKERENISPFYSLFVVNNQLHAWSFIILPTS